MNATLESVMALFEEVAERQKETDRLIKETRASQEETDRQMKKTDLKVDKLAELVGGVTGSLGDMAEGLMGSDLREKFAALGLYFEYMSQNFVVKEKKTGRNLAEVDILLINGTVAMVVEAKTTMTRGDVDEHEERMATLRLASHSLFGKRKLYGAMAGVKMSPKAQKYAIEKGFYVIELTGETIKINTPEGFTPWIW
jgi:hypothetical protein